MPTSKAPSPPPLASVIMPIHNAATTLADAVASVQAQTLTGWELLLIDDGSTDASLAIARALQEQDPRIRVYSQPSAGASAARNLGLDQAAGEYIAFLDADDLLVPDALETLIAAERIHQCGAAAGIYEMFSTRDGALMHSPTPASQRPIGLREIIRENILSTISQVIRRDRVGTMRFDRSLTCYEDQHLWLRLAEAGVFWSFVPRTVARYRLGPGSLSKSARMLPCAEAVYTEAQARTGAMSREELENRLADFAWAYATRAAIAHAEPGAATAVAIFSAARVQRPISCERAEYLGYLQAMFALGVVPDRVQPAGPQARPLDSVLGVWWRACATHGWMTQDDARLALKTFRQRYYRPDVEVADALLEDVPPQGVTLIGLGQNGRLIAERARARGIPLVVRDDRMRSGEHDFEGMLVESMDAPLQAGRIAIVTPLHDLALAARFPLARRWCITRDALVGIMPGD